MARITTAGDRRVTTAADVRVTNDGLVTFATISQSVRKYYPAETVATLDQTVYLYYPAATVATVQQAVRLEPVVYPAATAATLDQTVELLTVYPAETIATLAQSVQRHEPAETIATLAQRVLSPAAAATNTTFVTLNGQDITANVAPSISITATEGDNRTAALRLRQLPPGPLDVTGYEGKSLVITRLIGGSPVVLFTGKVAKPVWDRDNRQLVLECSDFRNRRVAREDHDRLIALTGGLYSPITQREDAEGEQWVRELLKTVPGTLDYASNGTLQYRPWAVGTPSRTLTDADVYYEDIRLEFATADEIVNTIPATLEYRYFRRNAISHAVSLAVVENNYARGGRGLMAYTVNVDGQDILQIQPSKAAILSAAEGVGGWMLLDLEYREIPPNGWYRNTSNVTQKVNFFASEAARATRCYGADLTLERYISQPLRETYNLSITAPESVDQYGEIKGQDMRFSAETRVDGSVYEERGCTVVVDPDDRRADVELAIQCMQRMGEKVILAAHRKNYAEVVYKAELLPVEIGQTIQIDTSDFDVLGTVTEFSHTATGNGDHYTTLKLAVSRVDSGVTVTEDWSLPAPPSSYNLNAESQSLPSTPSCPAPLGEAEVSGPSRLEPDGTVVITAPTIDRSQVDEIIGERAVTYPVAIPKNTFTVEVPAR